MFGVEALEVVIGMIFIYLLFSLLVGVINELISNLLNLRGRKFFRAIKQVVKDAGLKKLEDDPRFRLLIKKDFSASETENLSKSEQQQKPVHSLNGQSFPDFIPDELFNELFSNSDETATLTLLDSTKKNVEKEFDYIVAEAQRLYRSNVKKVVFFIGFTISIFFNVDSISIFNELSNNPEKAALITENAVQFMALSDSMEYTKSDSMTVGKIMFKIENINENQLNSFDKTLGLGWNFEKENWGFEPINILGWVITSFALSLGAPFWFDLLKKVINLKNELKGKSTEKERVG